MKKEICCIVCAGENKLLDKELIAENYIVAADGGLNYLNEIGVNPNLIVGDFDSVNEPKSLCEIIKLKQDKDETDTMVCIQEGIKRGYKEFYIFCGTGGRIDHTIANIQSLIYLSQKKCIGFLFDGEQVITVISNSHVLSFSMEASGSVSVFAVNGCSKGVILNGLKYALNGGILSEEFPLGVSNKFIGEECHISCDSGNLAVVFPLNALKHLVVKNRK